MSKDDPRIHCLIMTDFVEQLFNEYRIPVEIEHGGWLTRRVPFTPEEMIDRINSLQINLAIIEVDEIKRKVMESCPSLEVIASLRANPENVDLAAAEDHGIIVLNTPGRNSHAVAEFTLCLILDLLRHISFAYLDLAKGKWGDKEEDPYLRFRGNELRGKTVGIVGLGAIGQAVARLLSCFEVKIIAHDPYQSNKIFQNVQASKVDLHTLFSESDIITIHAPLNNQTKSIINENLMRRLQPGVIFINTARANLVDKDALLNGLKNGRIAAAGLDVHYDEPLSPEDPIFSLTNVIFTPHIGGATYEVITRGSKMVMVDLNRLFKGETPIHATVYPKINLRFMSTHYQNPIDNIKNKNR